MAIQRDITEADDWFIGEDKSITDTIYQSDGTTPQNVTGWAISFLLKRSAADVAPKVTKTTADGIALTTPGSGLITITIADTDTASLKAGTYLYEIKRTDDGFETVLTHGSCLLRTAVHP